MNHTPKGVIYANLLLPLRHGHPLWLPEPTKHSLPEEYSSKGVQIGDVGVFTTDGGFEFLFNVCLPADHPINQFRGTPSNFIPIRWNGRILETPSRFRPGELICSQDSDRRRLSVAGSPAGAGQAIALSFRNRRGAVLMLPNGASRFDCADVATFREYANMNAPDWYRFVRVTLGREPKNVPLRLIVGFDKSDSWEMALVDSNRAPTPPLIFYKDVDGRINLKKPFRSSALDTWVTTRDSTSIGMKNQTLFIRALSISFRGSVLVLQQDTDIARNQRYLLMRNVLATNYSTSGSKIVNLNDSDGYSSDTSEYYTARNASTIDEEHDANLSPSRPSHRSPGAVDDSIVRDCQESDIMVISDSDITSLIEELVNLLRSAVESGEEGFRSAMIGLQGADAQSCADLIQDVCFAVICYSPLDSTHSSCFSEVIDKCTNEHHGPLRHKTHRLLVKLSRSRDILPSSLFIKDIVLQNMHAQSGGAFGDIYRAMYRDSEVAVKRIRVFPSTPESDRQKLFRSFYREAILWRALQHPYVLPFLGVDSDTFPGFVCLVSPWMKNGTIIQHLRKVDGHDVDLRLFEIAQALAYLHSQDIVHGDLRGSNILVDPEFHACIADFGLSVFSDGTLRTNSSQHGGSMRWMAPELHLPQGFGLKSRWRTFASDVYSFACVCVELYTRERPFKDVHNDAGVLLKVIKGERPKRPSRMKEAKYVKGGGDNTEWVPWRSVDTSYGSAR
ncbi:hypothetical protein Moror_5241 [Moniliophthora roreri MCA 2997]|uniref:Protein kinase domain-containing protein n=1 Tax=Moniliophthora roreri (strain MCA 2997) TaxID=1381753 RepID=V2X8S1_MONRO|nr:hypothetical protein Moror_5241 [Moniliophthora roreri MCA 2997]